MDLLKTNSIQKVLKTFILIFIGTMALTISAKLKIPFYPVPMTMQTFVVLFLGIAFGYKIGLATVGVYLLEGIIGIPVFSNSPEKGVGLVYFTGPTMGYLIGFLVATFLSGYLKPINNLFTKILSAVIFSYPLFILLGFFVFDVLGFNLEPTLLAKGLYLSCLLTTIVLAFKLNVFANALILLISVLPIYILGIFWLGIVIGWDKPLFEMGVFPFLLAESFKIFLLAILYSNFKKLRKFI